jgi:hypothetical protein
MDNKEISTKANMNAVDALEEKLRGKDEKPVPAGKVRIPVDFTVASLEAIDDMFDQLGSSKTTKSDTTDLCIEIAYMLFKEIQAGGEVYIKPFQQDNPEGTEIYQLNFPGMVDENLPSIDDPSIQAEIPVHEDVIEEEDTE